MEKLLQGSLSDFKVHVCIDGPSGTGKSSLGMTMLKRLQISYAQVQVTQNMTWHEFCVRLAKSGADPGGKMRIQGQVGVDKGLPTALAKFEIDIARNATENNERLHDLTKNWNEYDVAEMMAKMGLVLYIDDFERANVDIISRTAEISKLMTQSFEGKVVVSGTDDIYRRLYDANKSIESRFDHVSVGTLGDKTDSWKFLTLGFEKLGRRSPQDSQYAEQRRQVPECQNAVYRAADGLPKSVNELGRRIVTGVGPNRHISAGDIFAASKLQFDESIKKCTRNLPRIIDCIRRNPVARAVLTYLYSRGIGEIFSALDMSWHLADKLDPLDIELAIDELVGSNFLVRTGQTGDILFTAEPHFAHIFGIILSDPQTYADESLIRSLSKQLLLPIGVEKTNS